MTRLIPPSVLLAGLLALPAAGDGPAVAPAPRQAPPAEPWYVDDAEFFDGVTERLKHFAEKRKGLTGEKLAERLKPRRAAVAVAGPGDKPLTPAEVYRRAVPSVFVLASTYQDPDTGDWLDGVYATAWAAAADGVLVTNWHVLEDVQPGEVFAAADHRGNVYPVTDILGGDKAADVLVIRVAGRGFAPLPVADEAAPVGSWVGVLSHPGDYFYVFTQGHVSRYSTGTADDGSRERWMGVTAEYATGSSGGPVLDDRGNVVGMTALTVTIDAPAGKEPPKKEDARRRAARKARAGKDDLKPKRVDEPKKGDPKPKGKDEPKKDDPKKEPLLPGPPPGATQMVVKLAVPGPVLRAVFKP